MNMVTQTRLLACWILLGCCLVTAILNIRAVTTVINLITFVSASVVLLQELARIHREMHPGGAVPGGGALGSGGSGGDIPGSIALGCALVAGASLVGGILDTDVIDGVTLVAGENGQIRECGGSGRFVARESTFAGDVLPYASWFVSMLGFLCCPLLRARWIARETK